MYIAILTGKLEKNSTKVAILFQLAKKNYLHTYFKYLLNRNSFWQVNISKACIFYPP